MALSLGLVLAAFIGGRTLGPGDAAVAVDETEQTGPSEPPGPDVRPDPLATPDTAADWWYVPYQNEYDEKPRSEQIVAGIRVGPDVEREWKCTRPKDSGPDPALRLAPTHLPTEATLFESREDECASELEYVIETDPDAARLISSGEKSYFEVNHGGLIEIFRFRAGPAYESSIASDHWFTGSVAGRPAAIGAPIIDLGTGPFAGMGPSIVIVHEDGILTVVEAENLSLAEILRIAEGVFQ